MMSTTQIGDSNYQYVFVLRIDNLIYDRITSVCLSIISKNDA
jgi:hypothetical protein